jgi:hypothetical protein
LRLLLRQQLATQPTSMKSAAFMPRSSCESLPATAAFDAFPFFENGLRFGRFTAKR